MDRIDITGLNIATKIGIYAWEQQILQKLLIDISIPLDLTQCKNDLKNSIDYDALCQRVTQFVSSNNFELIETVAELVASLIQDEFKVKQVTIKISKPNAIKNASNVSVTISR